MEWETIILALVGGGGLAALWKARTDAEAQSDTDKNAFIAMQREQIQDLREELSDVRDHKDAVELKLDARQEQIEKLRSRNQTLEDENVYVRDRNAMLEATLRDHGIPVPPPRRRTDPTADQLAVKEDPR